MRRVLAISILLLLAAAGPTFAQSLKFTADGSTSVAMGTEHKAVVGQPHEDDTIFLLDFPAMSVWSAGARSYFVMSWRPEWDYFDRHSQSSSWNHGGRL